MVYLNRSSRRAAFTLIELLVVITIISLLISILLPALGQAKKTARMLAEQAAGGQFMTSYAAYSNDYKEGLLIPYVHWNWAHPSPGPMQHRPHDFFNNPAGDIEGDVVKVWPLRFMYYAGTSSGALPPEAIVNDRAFLASLRSRSSLPDTAGMTTSYENGTPTSTSKFPYGLAWHPSFGLNSVYVGGHYLRGAFPLGSGTRVGHPINNHFYVSTMDRIRKPSTLLIGATSRSYDVAGAPGRATIAYGGSPVPISAQHPTPVPGYYEVLPPRTGFPMINGATASPWNANNNFNKTLAPNTWGFLDARHFSKVITTHADGHVELQKIEQLRDMRKWSNRADRPDWNYTPGNS